MVLTYGIHGNTWLPLYFKKAEENDKNHHESDKSQHIMPYETSTGRVLRVIKEYHKSERCPGYQVAMAIDFL